jgi:hypothetical protein
MERGNKPNGDEVNMASGTFGYRLGDGAPGAVKIEGLSAVQRDLRRMESDLDLVKGEFLETNRKVAEVVIEGSKKYVPVLSGALAQSIRDASTKKSAKIRVGSSGRGRGKASYGGVVEYAGPIHFGWPARYIKPQPFIYEATDQRKSEVSKLYAERITQIRNKYDL